MPIKAVLLMVAVAACAASLWARGRSEGPAEAMVGTDLVDFMEAPDFSLTDQKGAAFRMADTRDKVVVMTFIYTHCTDVCPLIAVKLKAAFQQLGSASQDVVVVAVTTDPARDTTDVLASYSREAGLYDVWRFVTGTEDELQRVWAAYGVGVVMDPQGAATGEDSDSQAASETGGDMSGSTVEEPDLAKGLTDDEVQLAGTLAGDFGGGYEVAHTAPFMLIDRKGMIRVLLNGDATPSDIAKDVRILLRR